MLQNHEANEYTPEQIMRLHAATLYHTAFNLCQALEVKQMRLLQDPINMVLSGVEIDADANIQGMSTDPDHYGRLARELEEGRETVGRECASPLTKQAQQLVNASITGAMKIKEILEEHPELATA